MGYRNNKQSGTGGKNEKGLKVEKKLYTRHASRVTEV